jgi:protein SMG9
MQPVYSLSILIDMMMPDGSSTLTVLSGDPLPADLAGELMGIQVNTSLK